MCSQDKNNKNVLSTNLFILNRFMISCRNKHRLFIKMSQKHISESWTQWVTYSCTINFFVILSRMEKELKVISSNKDLRDSLFKLLTLVLFWKSLLLQMLIVFSNVILLNKNQKQNKTYHCYWQTI